MSYAILYRYTKLFKAIIIILLPSITLASDLIPSDSSDLYYEIGGGNDIPLPAFYDSGYIPLNANTQVGLGFNCGIFNPQAALTDSLNQIKSSFLAVQQQVLDSATAAVTTFPLYELSRADPNLYNLITTNIAGAHADIGLSTKSCQTMQAQIAAGQDPYAHWAQLSLGNKWKQEIGTASLSGQGDINQTNYQVGQDNGDSGVLWIAPDYASHRLKSSTPCYAGGKGQPPIQIIHDVVTAGYQVILNNQDNMGTLQADSNFLTQVFPDADTVPLVGSHMWSAIIRLPPIQTVKKVISPVSVCMPPFSINNRSSFLNYKR